MRGQQGAGGFGAAAADGCGGGGLAVQHQRLVARLHRRVARAQHAHAAILPPVAPADDAGFQPLRLQTFDQRGDNRRFARAARMDVADDDDGHGQFFAFQTACSVEAAA